MSQYSAAAGIWSPPQMIRLENEWRRLQRSFAYHPLVQIIPLTGDPPGEYQVQYKVTTLAINQEGQLAYINTCPVHIWLPPQYPHAPPVVRPLTGIYHPNAAAEWIYIPWNPNMTLAQLVTLVGQLLAYQNWDVNGIVNASAMDWVSENQHLVPTDPTANFGPDADGEPLGRIIRYGAQTVEQIRTRIEEMLKRIVSTAPPMPSEVQRFGEQTRLALSMFSDTDVPEHLKSAADELDEIALSLATPDSSWFVLGKRFAAAQAAVDGANAMREAVKGLHVVEAAFEKLSPGDPSEENPVETLFALPVPEVLQASVMSTRKTLKTAEQRFATLRERADALQSLPGVIPQGTPGLPLFERFSTDITRVDQAMVTGRDMSAAATAEAKPAIGRTADILAAMDRILEWAEYADLLKRGHGMVDQAVNIGPAAIQAFYLVGDDGGENGPFQYEHRLDTYGARIAVSNLATTVIDILDTRSGQVIGHGDGDDVTVNLPGATEAPTTITVRPTDHTEEMRVPLEYLVTETRERFATLMGHEQLKPAESWAARHNTVLSAEAAAEKLQEEHRSRRQIWKGLLLDLVALGRYKQRLATYGQLERTTELVPRIRVEVEKLEALLKHARTRIADIISRSGRDLETEAPIIPSKFGEEYKQRVAERDKATRHLPRLQKLLATAIEQLRRRWSNDRLIGTGGTPAFYILPAVPTELVDLDPRLRNDRILKKIAALEGLLATELKPAELELPAEEFGGAPLPSATMDGGMDLGASPDDLAGAETAAASTDSFFAARAEGEDAEPAADGEYTTSAASASNLEMDEALSIREAPAATEEFVADADPAAEADQGDWFVVSDDEEAHASEEER